MQVGQIVADKYRVEEILARGGMGLVVSARHLTLNQQVAIKVLLPSELTQEPHAVTRFLREARAAAGLKSDHVVRIYDVGTLQLEGIAEGLPYMVMERLEGMDLRTLVRQQGPQSVEQAVTYVAQACDAVADAHENGIVHRDLKPSNLFLTQRRDGTPLVKVVDFGISKAVADATSLELTTSSVIMGSPLYMSPEQVRDARSVDHRTDIWALGVILYQLLTGRPPFRGDSLTAVCAAIAADPPMPIDRADVPRALVDVILRCLEKNKTHRFESAAELRDALLSFVAPRADVPAQTAEPVPASRGRRANLPPALDADEQATVSYGRLLADKSALRPPPPGIAPITEAPLASTLRSSVASPLRLAVAAVALLLAIGGVVTLTVLRQPGEERAEVTADQPAAEQRVSVLVRSSPSGAAVLRGDEQLGTTPLSVALSPAELRSRPALRLLLAGHEPTTVTLSDGETERLIDLTPLPEPAASASATATVKKPRAQPIRPSKPPAATHKPPDIRLER
jgi:serine/threonine-protein kinase